MGGPGARMQRAQNVQFGFGWRRRLADMRCEPYRPSGVFDDLIARYAGVERSDDEFVGLDLGFHHAQIIDNQRRTLGPQRSEEHTSELQSLMRISYAVFCLKKKTT